MSDLQTNLEQILNEKQTKIIPENIKKDVKIFDVIGTLENNTSDADATENNIEANKTAYVNGEKLTGTIIVSNTLNIENSVPSKNDETNEIIITSANLSKRILPAGAILNAKTTYSGLANAIGLTADKIKSGEMILGITGTYAGETTVEN